jgi:hypothetical protein
MIHKATKDYVLQEYINRLSYDDKCRYESYAELEEQYPKRRKTKEIKPSSL